MQVKWLILKYNQTYTIVYNEIQKRKIVITYDKINTFCRTGQLLRFIARSILKSHGLRTRTYDEAVKKHAQLTYLEHDYAAENDIILPQFENKDDDEVMISFDS
ncbi:Hypothetical_protein [Hexamita inflata]|uniref:Hypothetical_protein n=1 Tax=Hexamita inflata TaxID=28002 RepID=A0AA86PEH6_9EUKA|nr:Hypothetical protein HINF_LOCUS21922 [Hexamita inflata]